MDITNSGLQAVIDAGIATATPHELPSGTAPRKYAVVVPANGTVQIVDVDDEKGLAAPRRTTGVYTLKTVTSFAAYVQRHATDDLTVWVDEDQTTLTAVFNDARPDAPAWRDHRAVCALTLSEEWKHWVNASGKLLDQQAFAEHIEDGLNEIRLPDAATMLELAQTFHAHTNAEFRSGQRLSSGQVNFQYDEETTASAGTKGEIPIPEIIKLGIPVFIGEEAYAIDARLRYRLRAGKLVLGYKLDHPERVMRDAIELITARLDETFTDRVYTGAAPPEARRTA